MADPIDYTKINNLGISPEVLNYLNTLQQRQSRTTDPAYQYAMSQAQTPNTTPALMAALAKASAQMGTVGGKAADTSAVEDYGKNLQAAGQQQGKDLMTQQAMANQQGQQQIGEVEKFAGMQSAAEKQQQEMANQQKLTGQKIASEQQIAGQNLAGHMALSRAQMEMASGRQDLTQQNKVNQRVSQFQKDMNEGLASQRTGMGKNKSVVDNADKILQVQEQAQTQPGGLDNRQMHEVAIATANLLSGGSGAAQGTIEALVPHTVGNDVAKLEEWLTSEPQGNNQQAFINRIFDTANREKYIANEKIKEIKSQVLPGYADLKQNAPEQYAAILNQNFGTSDLASEGARYQMKPFAMPQTPQGPQGESGSAYAAPAPAGGAAPATAPSRPMAKDGDVKTKDGVQYIRQGGMWLPQAGSSN